MLPLQLKWMSGMKHKILGTLGQRVLGSMDRGQLNLLDQFRQEGGATTKTKGGPKEEVRNVGGGGRREGRNGWPWEQGRGPLPRSNICESELNCAKLILAESLMSSILEGVIVQTEGLFTQKNPRTSPQKIRKKFKKFMDFFEDLKSVHLIWEWTTPRIQCLNPFLFI